MKFKNVHKAIESIPDKELLSQIYINNNGQLEFTWEGVTESTDRGTVKKLVDLVFGELKERFKSLGYKIIKEYCSADINVYDIGYTSLIDLILEKDKKMNKEKFLNSLENYKIGNDGTEILDYIKEKVVNKLDHPEKFEFGIGWVDAKDGSKKISVVSRFFGGNYSIGFKYDKKEYVLRFPTIDFKYKVDNFYLYKKDFIDGIMKNQHFDISKYGLTGDDSDNGFKDIFTTDDFDEFIDNVYKYIN